MSLFECFQDARMLNGTWVTSGNVIFFKILSTQNIIWTLSPISIDAKMPYARAQHRPQKTRLANWYASDLDGLQLCVRPKRHIKTRVLLQQMLCV